MHFSTALVHLLLVLETNQIVHGAAFLECNVSSAILEVHDPYLKSDFYSEVKFEFYHKKSDGRIHGMLLTNSNISSAEIDPSLETKILVHGWQSNPRESLMDIAVNEYLGSGRYNMILVDWSVEAGDLWYPGINTKAIGNYLGYVLSVLKFNYYASYRRMHCIGHSLGTHVCNYASLYLGKSLGRITGLDPADLTGNMKPIRGNAHFTDIIHTTILFGDTSPLADADFYPNGGKNQGSDCGQVCSHSIAINYFLTSITSSQYVGRNCDSWSDFKLEKCKDNELAIMGEKCSHRARGTFYLYLYNFGLSS